MTSVIVNGLNSTSNTYLVWVKKEYTYLHTHTCVQFGRDTPKRK